MTTKANDLPVTREQVEERIDKLEEQIRQVVETANAQINQIQGAIQAYKDLLDGIGFSENGDEPIPE